MKALHNKTDMKLNVVPEAEAVSHNDLIDKKINFTRA